MDERLARIYTWFVKTGKKTLQEIPEEYRDAVSQSLNS